jgi:outer membrane protein assembly factor BamA
LCARGDRNFEAHTVSIVFAIDEGPRTYIERIMCAAIPAPKPRQNYYRMRDQQ